MDFDSDGVRLHYEVNGPERGTPLVVVHGFASDYRLNWVGTRWQETLTNAGFRVIGLDCRGHGHSDKPHDEAAYAVDIMAADVVRLLDELDVPSAALISATRWVRASDCRWSSTSRTESRARCSAGIGAAGAIDRAERDRARAPGRRADRRPVAQTFYRFASSRPTNDLQALAACIAGLRPDADPARLAAIRTPILVVVGENDDIARGAPELVELIPTARLVTIAGRDHMSAVPAREFKQAAMEFLED